MTVAHEIDRVLHHAVDTRVIAGAVALAADETGPIYAGAFGTRDGDAVMSPDTIFTLFSMTKPLTSVAAMQLVEQGRVRLDEPLGDKLPELGAAQVLDGFGADGTPHLRPPRRPITLRHLLTHTAGFAYHIWNADTLRYHDHTGVPTIATGDKACLTSPLACDPGERWEYGISTDWVGQVVERITGQPLDAYFAEYLLAPLGMHDTSFALRPDQRPRLARRWFRQPDGSLDPLPFDDTAVPDRCVGGGGLYGTGPDYLRFLRMWLGGGELDGVRILRAETIAEMSENHIGDLTAGTLNTALPEVSNSVEFFPGIVKKWGLGTMLTTEKTAGGRSAGSLTWGGLANTYFWIDPVRRVTGVLMTQILPFADPGVLDLFAQFERAVYATTSDRTW
jgi:CubicO group peptidase (beta-lactamase class C family)